MNILHTKIRCGDVIIIRNKNDLTDFNEICCQDQHSEQLFLMHETAAPPWSPRYSQKTSIKFRLRSYFILIIDGRVFMQPDLN